MHVETQEAPNSQPFVSYRCAFPGTLQNSLEEGTLTIFFEWFSIGTACTTHAKRRHWHNSQAEPNVPCCRNSELSCVHTGQFVPLSNKVEDR